MEQERHGSIFNTQSKDFPQGGIPPALFSLRSSLELLARGAAYRKKMRKGAVAATEARRLLTDR
mgnify:CR=1